MTTTIIFLAGLGIGTIAGFIAAALLSRSSPPATDAPDEAARMRGGSRL